MEAEVEVIIKVESSTHLRDHWRYFWCKRVRDFNPANHCAACFVGSYLKPFGLEMPINAPQAFNLKDGEIIYMCGVSKPYKWEKNFHLALRVKEGSEVVADTYCGNRIRIRGCEKLTFDATAAAKQFPDKGKAFLSCRNFQFGATHFKK